MIDRRYLVLLAPLVAIAACSSKSQENPANGADSGLPTSPVVDGDAGAGDAAKAVDPDVADLVERFTGGYSTREQAEALKAPDGTYSYTSVDYYACPVTLVDDSANPVDDGKVYLYEQRKFLDLSCLHHQRIFSMERLADGRVDMAIHHTTDVKKFIGLCSKPKGEHVIRKSDIVTEACHQFYTRKGDQFVGATPPEGCPTVYAGAKLIKSDAIVYKDGKIDVWGRFYDAKGDLVLGVDTTEPPYKYLRFAKDADNAALAAKFKPCGG